MIEHLPVHGPSEVFGGVDELEPAVAVVRVALALTRTQLVTAIGMGFAGLTPERTPESLSDAEVRAEIEGVLASEALSEIDRQMERDQASVWPPEQERVMAVLAAAVDRAYAAPPAPASAVQDPRYAHGRVVLRTVDKGEVTVGEPDWCLGHEGEPVGYFADVTHNGPVTALEFDGVELLAARLSWAPFGELEPEPYPVASVDELGSLEPVRLRELAAKTALYAGELYRLANQAERLRGYGP